MGEEAELAEAVGGGDDDDVVPGQALAVRLAPGGHPELEPAAVDVEHHREPPGLRLSSWSPDVEEEAVLALLQVAARRTGGKALHARRAEVIRRPHARPRRRRLGRAPAKVAHGRCGEGDPQPGGDPILVSALDQTLAGRHRLGGGVGRAPGCERGNRGDRRREKAHAPHHHLPDAIVAASLGRGRARRQGAPSRGGG